MSDMKVKQGKEHEKEAGYSSSTPKGAREGMKTGASKLDKEIKSVAGKDSAQYAEVDKQPKQMGA